MATSLKFSLNAILTICVLFFVAAIVGAFWLTVESQRTDTPKCEVECVGLVPRDESTEEVLRWVKKKVALGDEISFKVVEVSESQSPFDTQVIPKESPHV